MSKYAINLNNKIIDLKDLDEFSFNDYNKLTSILKATGTEVNKQKALINLFTGLDYKDIDTINNIFVIDFGSILKQEIKSKKLITEFDGTIIPQLSSITIGRFIDLEYYLMKDNMKIEQVVALLVSPLEYSIESLEVLTKKVVSDMKVMMAAQLLDEFSKFRTNMYDDYAELFNKVDADNDVEDKEDKAEVFDNSFKSDNSWGLMEFVYFLSNNDILNVDNILDKKLYSILNYLTWQKEQAEKQKKQS